MANITSVLFIAFALASNIATAAVQPGEKAPNFKAKDIDGNSVELSAYLGKYVIPTR